MSETNGVVAPAMEKIAFRMLLKPGMQNEYRRRHDAVDSELTALLRKAGVRDYSIHWDPETNHLFAVLWRPVAHGMDDLPKEEVMRRWWAMMVDIMETRDDDAPVAVPLPTLFHMA